MRKRGGRGGQVGPPGSPAWMTTFSDLTTQILAFFILLYSMSNVSEAKFRDALVSLQGALGVLPASTGVMPSPLPAGGDPSSRRVSLSSLEQELREAIKNGEFEDLVRLERGDRSIRLHFDAGALFDSGRFELKPDGLPQLDAIGAILTQVTNPIRIEGHTDSDPMRPNQLVPDNWALSAHRARSVLLYLNRFHTVPQTRMHVAAYAEHRPVAPNDTPQGKALNRRVEIVVLEGN